MASPPRRLAETMPEDPKDPKAMIGFAGMTHLGLNSAAAAAERGFKVAGFDSDTDLCAALRDGRPPVMEPGLPELLSKNAPALRFDADPAVLADCDVVYVAPDVPTDDLGESDLDPVHELIRTADDAMGPGACLVVLSQVPPGFMRGHNFFDSDLASEHIHAEQRQLRCKGVGRVRNALSVLGVQGNGFRIKKSLPRKRKPLGLNALRQLCKRYAPVRLRANPTTNPAIRSRTISHGKTRGQRLGVGTRSSSSTVRSSSEDEISCCR